MISNGSLITPEIIEKMTGLWHLDRIRITMDGNESDYISRHTQWAGADFSYQSAFAGMAWSQTNHRLDDVHGFFRRLQKGGRVRWMAAKKHAILRPFAWLYQAAFFGGIHGIL